MLLLQVEYCSKFNPNRCPVASTSEYTYQKTTAARASHHDHAKQYSYICIYHYDVDIICMTFYKHFRLQYKQMINDTEFFQYVVTYVIPYMCNYWQVENLAIFTKNTVGSILN